MKIKYLRLNKEKKRKVKQSFAKNETGIRITKYLKCATICSILCFCIGIYTSISAFINQESVAMKIYGITLCVIGIAGLVTKHKIYIKKINEYVIKNKNKF